MISRKELEKEADRLKYSAGQSEKDFFQHLFLSALYEITASEFIFKGGTALQKIWGLGRFSEDIDFNYRGILGQQSKIMELAKELMNRIYETEAYVANRKQNSVSYKFKIKGPLYVGRPLSICSITVDISWREGISLEPRVFSVVPRYTALRPYTLSSMAIEEILAEKIRALLTRTAARDLYDVWFLLSKGIQIDYLLIDQKLKLYGRKFDLEGLLDALQARRRHWIMELQPLVSSLPEFQEVLEVVESGLRGR